MTYPNQGIWMLYDWDMGYRLERISTELEPLVREVAQRGYGKVGWLPFDTDLQDAAKAWESQEPLRTIVVDGSRDWLDLAQIAGAISEQTRDAIRYFMTTTVTEEKGPE